MPELPEVETIVRQLKKNIVNKTITHVNILRPGQWKRNNPEEMNECLASQTITNIFRRAKFIVIDLKNDTRLVIHLRMTGKLLWSPSDPAIDKYTRTIFYLKNGESLQFNDVRTLGTLAFYTSDEKNEWEKNIGTEPLGKEWSINIIKDLCARSSLVIKAFLLDQKKIVGIGNIYASEILFRAKIHPERIANSLTENEVEKLFVVIPDLLNLAIDNMGTSLGDGKGNFISAYSIEGEFQKILKVYGRNGG